MMRRGPLDRYPVEWVLREAHAHGATGSIEFHVAQPVTVYVDGGLVYGATDDDPDAGPTAPPSSELEARRTTVALIERAVAQAGDPPTGSSARPGPGAVGWYYFDPLGHLAVDGSWSWELGSLLLDVRVRGHEERTLGAWTDRNVTFRPTTGNGVTLGPDAWALVAALASSAPASELRARLGWNPARMLAALTEAERAGILLADQA